MLPTRMHRVM